MRRMYGDFQMNSIFNNGQQQQSSSQQSAKKRKRHVDKYLNDDLSLPPDHHRSLPPGVPDLIGPVLNDIDLELMKNASNFGGDSYFKKWRIKRQTNQSFGRQNQRNSGGTVGGGVGGGGSKSSNVGGTGGNNRQNGPNIGPNPQLEPNNSGR